MALEESDAEAIAQARSNFEKMLAALDRELGTQFEEYDKNESREALASVRGLLNRRKYISNLILRTENVPN